MASSNKAPDTVLLLDSLLQIMKSNKPPTPHERQLTRHQMDRIDGELEKVQREIEALELQLAQLQARVMSLKGEKEEYLPILSPWRGLPIDILAEILQIAVNPGSTSFLSSINHPTDRMHFKNLRAVCRTWRDVAFSTQSLWTSVWVNFDHYLREDIPAVIRGVSSYFGRSGSAWPLELGFKWQRHPANPKGSEDDGQGSNCLFSDVWLAYLFSQRSRLREISLYTSTSLLELFNRELKGWAADGEVWRVDFLLVYLDRVRPNFAIAPTDPGGILPLSFPRLKSLSFTGTASVLSWDILRGHSNLSILHLTIDDINILFPTLVGFPCLEELYITFSGVASEHLLNDTTTLNVPYLRRLSLACFPSFSLFSKLQAPALTNLYIVSAPAQQRWATATVKRRWWETFPQVISFIQETGQQLEAFHLDSWFIQNDEVLRQLFSVLSSVKTLCTDTWYNDLDDFQSCNTSAYLPHLTSLCIHLPHGNPFTPSSSQANKASPSGLQPNRWKTLGAFLRSRSLKRLATNTLDPERGGDGDEYQAKLVVHLPEQARAHNDFEWGELEQLPGLDMRIVPSQWEVPGSPAPSRSSAQPFASKYHQIAAIPHPTGSAS